MADRSNFPKDVPVLTSDMVHESTYRQEDDQRTQRDAMQMGVNTTLTSNFSVVPAGNGIQVNPGSGYTGDDDIGGEIGTLFGSFIKLSRATTISWPNATYPYWGYSSFAVTYYVCAVYNEVTVENRPDLNGTGLFPVRTESSSPDCTFEILTDITYSGYTEVGAYSDLSTADKHKRIRLAKIYVSAGGKNTLTATDITLPYSISRIKTSTPIINITGVSLVSLGVDTPDGTGTLTFTIPVPSVSPARLTWQAYGDSSPGYVDISADMDYTITSSGGSTLTINVTTALLPTANKTDSLTVSSLYEPDIRPESGTDRLHRSMGGSGVKTVNNPHGLTLKDMGGQTSVETLMEDHRKTQHDAGIIATPSTAFACLQPLLIPVNSGIDYVQIVAPSGSNFFYVNGKKYYSILSSDREVSGVYTISFDDHAGDKMTLWEIGIDTAAKLTRSQRLQFTDSGSDPTIAGVLPLRLMLEDETTTPAIALTYVSAQDSLMLTVDGNDGEPVFLAEVIPGADGLVTLPGPNAGDALAVYVNHATLFALASDKTDNWVVLNTPMDTNLYCVLCTVVSLGNQLYGEVDSWLSPSGSGYLIASVVPTPNSTGVCDRRSFGTTGGKDLNRSAREYINNTPVGEDRILTDAVTPIKIEIMQPTPFSKKLFGSGVLGDVTYLGAQDFTTTRVVSFRNLTLGPLASLTNSGPYLVILVQDTLIINAGAIISLIGEDGEDSINSGSHNDGTLAHGGIGKGGNGGNGGYRVASAFGSKGDSGWGSPISINNIFCPSGTNADLAGFGGFGSLCYNQNLMAGGGGGGGASAANGLSTHYGGGGGAAGGGFAILAGGFGGDGGDGGGDSEAGSDGVAYYKSPITFTSIPEQAFRFYNSGGIKGWGGGGGGGGAVLNDHWCCGGGGGGGGGAIYIEARHIVFKGTPFGSHTFDVKGGNGGSPWDSDSGVGGSGGGGAGGTICIICEHSIGKTTDQMAAIMSYAGGTKGAKQVNQWGSHGAQGGDGGNGCAIILNLEDLS